MNLPPMEYAAISPRFIDSDLYLSHTKDSPLALIDGGARGRLFDPFDVVKAPLEVLAFDPDEEALRIKPSQNVSIQYIDRALWNGSQKIQVHLAAQPATSSVYPPNLDLLRTFPDTIGAPPRTTTRIVEIDSISIDEAVQQGLCSPPTFIKLDIHSAEFEALEGARLSLQSACGVLVESWHTPIHRGQHLTGELEWLLNREGFHLFNFMHNSPWMHVVDGRDCELDRPRLVGSESLFFREDYSKSSWSAPAAFHAVGLADLFRYNRYAVLLSRNFLSLGILDSKTQSNVEEELNRISLARLKKTRVQRFLKRQFRGLVRKMLS